MLKENIFSLLVNQHQSLIILNRDKDSDHHLIEMISKKLNIGKEDIFVFSSKDGVDQLRKNIANFYLKPNRGDKRLFMVVGVDLLNREQANTLLKIIEEPPSYGKIVLISRNKANILKTILSRCHFIFAPVKANNNDRESILKVIGDSSFKDFTKKIGELNREDAADLLSGGLEELRQKGLNESTALFFKELGKSLSIVESTNCSYKLILERLYFFIRFSTR